MNANAVHVDGASDRKRKTGKGRRDAVLFSNPERDRERRRARTGGKCGDDRFPQPQKEPVRIFAAKEEDCQRIDKKDHSGHAGDHASDDLEVGTEKEDAAPREIDETKGADAEREIFHDPIDQFKRDCRCCAADFEERFDIPFFRVRGFDRLEENPRRQSEEDRKENDRQKTPFGQRLKRVLEQARQQSVQSDPAPAAFHRLKFTAMAGGGFDRVGHTGVQHERGADTEKRGEDRCGEVPEENRPAEFS